MAVVNVGFYDTTGRISSIVPEFEPSAQGS